MSFLETSTKSWHAVWRTLIFLAGALSIIFIFAVQLAKHVNPSSVKVSAEDGVSIDFGLDSSLNSMLVHPRGWQSSGVFVKGGDLLTLDASGSVNIAMGRMVQSLIRQYEIKARNEISAEKKHSRSLDEFTDDELNESLFAYPWNGPTGIELSDLTAKNAIARIEQLQSGRVYPKARVGQLLAVIGPSNRQPPDVQSAQVIPYTGNSEKIKIRDGGFIWFIINDERMTDDFRKTTILWQDNLGMFSVNIVREGT